MKDLILVSGPEPAAQNHPTFIFSISGGVSTKAVSIRDGCLQRVLDEFQPGTYCLAISGETLAAVRREPTSAAGLQKLLDECCGALLIFACNGSTEQHSAFSWLTAGVVSGIRPLEDQRVGDTGR